MIKSIFLIFFLTTVPFFGQNISEINKNLRLSDTLEFEKEIRIYKDYAITNRMEIFRMYDTGTSNWNVTIYYYSKNFNKATKINEVEFPKENLGELKPSNANLIWLNLLLCNIEFLPNLKAIEYKLNTSSIEFDQGEYEIIKKIKRPLDGVSYEVFIKNNKTENHFIFDNPKSYLKLYPNVDEIISYNKILSIINKEFNL